MNINPDTATSEKILEIIGASPIPLSTRNVGVRLRQRNKSLPDHMISSLLREMLREGRVEFQIGRWAVSSPSETIYPSSQVIQPPLSAETLSILGRGSPRLVVAPPKSGVEWTEPKPEPPEAQLPSGRWEPFRKLVGYYRQCIRNEEGADASAFQNELGKRFVYLRKVGLWHPRSGFRWRTTIPLGSHLSPLLRALPGTSDNQALVVGYPVQAYYKKNENEPDVAIIRPIFFFTVEHTISHDGLIVICENPKPELNLGWLDYAFSRRPGQQQNFLSACGFINRSRPNDEVPDLERGEVAPSLDNLVAALTFFMPEKIRQPLELGSIPDHPLRIPFDNGVYNRAVLMLAKRTKYTSTLLKELAAIEKAPDDVLNKTALSHIFTRTEEQSSVESEEILHAGVVAETVPLNADQRRATASLLTRDITVVTGPPGTGKSQVVSSAVINARLRGQTVLFASRNHKAIDAVVCRLDDPDGRSLMVRTNSKDDPNLNVTFVDAIKEMLTDHNDATATENLNRVKDELSSLLEDRGKKTSLANQTAEAATALGEIEERMSYLDRDLPNEITTHLDTKPESFPTNGVKKVVQIVRTFNQQSSERSFFIRIFDLIQILAALPWYRGARRRLRRIPGAFKLPSLPTPKTLRSLLPELWGLEQAGEYARLRVKCHPYEEKINNLPPLEDTVKAVDRLSNRIEKLALQAVPLDLDSRRGLPPGANREELDGLRAAIKAMRTGLSEGKIGAETVRILADRTRYILQAFPCWAVTNLSAGSRIPLVASMFDLSIIDEASQSDTPSAIPILYRAKRAGVVGDPFQLNHTSKLSTAKDTMLRRQLELKRVEDVRFAYTESSIYDLFASTSGVEPIFLSETYRSAAEIADYSSFTFYKGRLRVATDPKGLIVPRGISPGIHWTEISGEVQSGGGSGCYCREEVNETVKILRTMLLDNNFRGTVGVVTPFRQQANRIRDVLFEGETRFYEALTKAQTHVDTAHGFQGDERDVIVLSLCAGPDMPVGSRSFLLETGHLFNVAVSRARAVLHVVGNRNWARRCSIHHLERLASPQKRASTQRHKTPWHPHESPWEEKLFEALVEVKLEPRPQFPVSSRRLDLALIRKEPTDLKIDIEVDGDCHRNADGTRKIDDLWRDIQLQGMGWKVMRFWTYQLREDLDGCVEKILKAWR